MSESAHRSIIGLHYIRFWGEPASTSEIGHLTDVAGGKILVAEFAPRSRDYDWVYATIGASDQPMPYPPDWIGERPERRIELFIYSRQRNPELRSVLYRLTVYPFTKHTFLGVGHMIPGAKGVIAGSPLTDILLTPPYGEQPEFEVVHLDEARHARILWVIPIYTSERDHAKKNGWRALIDQFSAKQVDTSDFSRSPVA